MRILGLGPLQPHFVDFLRSFGDDVQTMETPLTEESPILATTDFIISYGYRHILKPGIIRRFRHHAINLHISLLPWNRGADPNVWSWLEDTPKGLTIHYMDEGVDTGDILVQREMTFSPDETLRSTYQTLSDSIEVLFKEIWPHVRTGAQSCFPQPPGGSSHRVRDLKLYASLMAKGWDTPVRELIGRALPHTALSIRREACHLRPMAEQDSELILRWRNSDRVRQYMYSDELIGPARHRAWFERMLADPKNAYLVFEVEGRPLGLVYFNDIDRTSDRCLWGFYRGELDAPRGSGLAMGFLGLEYGFERLGLRKIGGETIAFNHAAIRFHQTLGFEQEGYLREHVMKKGVPTDAFLFALRRQRWLTVKPRLERLIFHFASATV